jgi:hypothetical protein
MIPVPVEIHQLRANPANGVPACARMTTRQFSELASNRSYIFVLLHAPNWAAMNYFTSRHHFQFVTTMQRLIEYIQHIQHESNCLKIVTLAKVESASQ